ncbi:hypothetical protein [Micromonospora sp. NPDC049240]|uniref:hypothetical protein n=1 Tax=Micromonospora sp. NPDC049240 TaxID=3155151 RepID=UPI0033F3EAC0
MTEQELAIFEAGKAEMLRYVLSEADIFRDLMKRRGYINNANGVRRFVQHLKARPYISKAQQ